MLLRKKLFFFVFRLVEVIYQICFTVFIFLLGILVELFTPILSGIEISVQVYLYYCNAAPSGILMYIFVTVNVQISYYTTLRWNRDDLHLSVIILLQSCTKQN